MAIPPMDTSADSWRTHREILAAMDGEARVRVALDLSDGVREIQIAGILSRNAGWTRADAVRYLVKRQFGVDLSGMP